MRKRAAGLRRQLVGVWIGGDSLRLLEHPWPVTAGSRPVGAVRAADHSPRLGRNIGLALVDTPHNQTGTELTVHHPAGRLDIAVADLPFCAPGRL